MFLTTPRSSNFWIRLNLHCTTYILETTSMTQFRESRAQLNILQGVWCNKSVVSVSQISSYADKSWAAVHAVKYHVMRLLALPKRFPLIWLNPGLEEVTWMAFLISVMALSSPGGFGGGELGSCCWCCCWWCSRYSSLFVLNKTPEAAEITAGAAAAILDRLPDWMGSWVIWHFHHVYIACHSHVGLMCWDLFWLLLLLCLWWWWW